MNHSMDMHNDISWDLHDRLGDIDYEDDVCLLSHYFSSMQYKMLTFATRAAKVGLKININKTKLMRINSSSNTNFQFMRQRIDDVENYVGSVVPKSGGSIEDIKNKLSKAR